MMMVLCAFILSLFSCYLISWHSKMTYRTGGRERPWLDCLQEWVGDSSELRFFSFNLESA